MAGAGYKLFQTGDVLTAAQVNTYLNEQTVMVFADAAARTTALTSVLAEGMVSYLQNTNAVEVYNGSAWVGVSGAGDVTEVQAGVGISVASGTGPIPVITNSSTDLITTAGDLLYGTAADTVARLGIGTAGQVLKVNSGATAPEWGAAAGGGGMTQIATGSFTGSSVVISSIPTTYKDLALVVRSLGNSANNESARIRFNNDSNANRHSEVSAYATTSNTAFASTYAGFTTDSNNTNDISLAYVYFPDYTNTATMKMFFSNSLAAASTSTNYNFRQFVGLYNQTTAITSLGFIPQNGTFTSGSYILYGVE
jgi:hypothetical protein